jgi:diguanylate cyclase (GGDEF)-like protein
MMPRSRFFDVLDRLGRLPRPLLIAILAGVTLLIGVVDYATGERCSLSVMYFPIISLTCWLVGLRPAIVLSMVASVLWIVDDHLIPYHPLPDAFKYWHTITNFAVLAMFAYVLSKVRAMLMREHLLSRLDELTGLSNRTALFDNGRRDLARCRRSGRPLTAVFIDLDEFKQVNDLYGHAEGDKVLRVTADCLRMNTRETDLTARIGGDEFVVIAPEMGYDAAQRYAERVQNCFRTEMARHGWPVTISLGIATFNSPPATVDEVVKAADDLMYVVKRREKNSVKHSLVDEKTSSIDAEPSSEYCTVESLEL